MAEQIVMLELRRQKKDEVQRHPDDRKATPPPAAKRPKHVT
jgi:hypothetical protein